MCADLEFWKLKAVVQKCGLSKTEIYRRIAEGRFPAAHSYGGEGARRFWLSTEIEEWQRQILAGETPTYTPE
ncbi:helix-turn-helix transcriptional regulator [Rhizorhapis sp.]|uniref:helix-turn-helix transcriptional regulator n=1 Tax=Rhizorhapis sp. TaxID=1968842 RepID=UPI002B483E4D|nr:AlpA family phage regulatory protein [Rhizorhapis sp.]HKR16622.1 AlpA family phage regulatory protein [Rhizorhapis sp.]